MEILEQGDQMKKKFTRLTAFTSIVLVIFSILIVRLVYIQIINGDYYKSVAEAKGEKQILELAPRGEILDRNKQKIATNLQSFNVTYSKVGKKTIDEEVNRTLLQTIRIVIKNGDTAKLNMELLPINITGNNYAFVFKTSDYKLKLQLEKNFKKKYEVDNSLNAKQTFDYLADNFGLTNDFVKANNIKIDELHKLVALRLAIKEIGFSQYKTVYIAKNVKRETAMSVLYQSNGLPGISCEVAPMRYYPNKEVGSAFIGYLGKIDDRQAEEYSSLGYDISRELVGKLGLEKVLENNKDLNIKLRGEPGFKYIDVDKYGRIIKQTATLDPIPGDTVITTIDMNIQKVAEKALDDTMKNLQKGKGVKGPEPNATRGAAIAVDVNTGEVLALVSRPGYDPNLFAEKGSISDMELYKKIFATDKTNENDPADVKPAPMFNYATMGSGPPGSTFKPLVGIAALQEGAITPSTVIVDNGIYTGVPGFRGACWIWNDQHGSHGPQTLIQALQHSCNVFFFETGRRLGYEKFSEWAWKFGLASNPQTNEKPSTGIEIDERPGDVSNPYKFKLTNIKLTMNEIIDKLSQAKYGSYTITKGTEEYQTIENMLMDGQYSSDKVAYIGITNKKAQTYLKSKIKTFSKQSSSVGELLNASIGQGSTLLTPLQMVSYISTLVNGGNRYQLHLVKEVLNPDGTVKKENQPVIMSKISLNQQYVDVIKEGMRKVTEEGGTASSTFANFSIPTGGKTGSASVSQGQKRHGRDAYGWFLGFAPIDNPKIAVCVVIYDAGHGGYAAPVAKAIYEQYFGLNKPKTDTQEKNKTTSVMNNNTENKKSN